MLTLTYIILAVAGCGYVLVALALGQVFDDAGAADGEFHFPLLSPSGLATLAGSLGAFGLIAKYGLTLTDGISLIVALPLALIFSYAATYAAWRVLVGSSTTSTIAAADLAGAEAEVITPIPLGGVGEAAAFVSGQRYTAPAREVDGLAVPRGAVVAVVRLAGSTLYVKAGLASAREPAPEPAHGR
jgi:membrane protein implicated in regulation of membrane protease activity